jgi:Chaperone of endosialidase
MRVPSLELDISLWDCCVERKSGRMASMKTSIPQSLILVLIVCFGSLQNAHAVSPPPDGGYPNFTTAEGQNALKDLTTGVANTALGAYSMFSTTTTSFNTAVGAGALDLNTGDSNTAVGAAALLLNTGTENTAVGTAALESNDTGENNTATGAFALFSNVSGGSNTAYGWHALFSDTSGELNTAIGTAALATDNNGMNGSFNTAVGASALLNNNGGDNNAVGAQALSSNTTGNDNTAIGVSSLGKNTSGSNNIAIGTFAGLQQTTGINNIYIGVEMEGTAGENNACYIADIDGQTSGSGIAVLINSSGKLGTTTSSKRFKEDIKPMHNTSEALFALKPVTFRYKKELDPQGIQQWGLVAEDVQRVNPALVALDKKGKPYSVRYDQVNAMLLNEFLKEHRKVQQLEANAARHQKDFEAAVAELKGQIQKVSAQLELRKSRPQTVLNSR